MDVLGNNAAYVLAATAAAAYCCTRPRNQLDETTTSIPVVGQNIVVGSKTHKPTKILTRPPHKIPPATWHKNPDLNRKGPLSKEQVKKFFEDGYLFLPEFYKQPALDAVEKDVDSMINNLAIRLHSAGKIKDLYEGLDWTSRLLRMRRDFPDAPVILIKGGVLPVSLQKMFAEEKILDVATQLGLGPDIALNAAWNLRGKMPAHEETVVPWHQDNSYWEPRVWDEKVLTVWAALVDATVENGCMQMMKGAHACGKTASHTIGTTTSTWYTEVSEETMARELLGTTELVDGVDKITIPCKAGGVLIFPGTTPHRSLDSFSDNIRWSCDFRLHPKKARRPGKGGDLDWFYGLKDSLLLREDPKVDPHFKPSFADWAAVDRTEVQDKAKLGDAKAEAAKETFDPVIVGPWMDLWDLETDVRGLPNQHVDTYIAQPEDKRDVKAYSWW